jgi:hypothetical protein
VKVPPKRDTGRWGELEARITESRLQAAEMDRRASVRRRHAIEKRLKALEGRPRSRGTDALIRELRTALAGA